MFLYLLLVLAVFVLFFAYNEPAFIGSTQQTAATFTLLVLYGASAIPLAYCYTFLFNSSSTAQIGIILLNIVFGFVAVIAHQVGSLAR